LPGGLPRGCLTEVFWRNFPRGSISLLASCLAGAPLNAEGLRASDAQDSFDPVGNSPASGAATALGRCRNGIKRCAPWFASAWRPGSACVAVGLSGDADRDWFARLMSFWFRLADGGKDFDDPGVLSREFECKKLCASSWCAHERTAARWSLQDRQYPSRDFNRRILVDGWTPQPR